MATGAMPKDLQDHIPVLADQGMKNLVGSPARGISMQYLQKAMPAGGVIVFADEGLENMANATYGVFIHNHTDETKQGTCANAARLTTQITITGPTAADVLDIVIVGQVDGQLGA